VAWLSRLRISSVAFFAFFLAGLRVGMENLQIEMQVPAAFGGILEGMILLCVLAGQFFYLYRPERCKAIPDEGTLSGVDVKMQERAS
jgi:simple sugar transport system permease protein